MGGFHVKRAVEEQLLSLSPTLSLSRSSTHTHRHTDTHTLSRTHTHTHTHTHMLSHTHTHSLTHSFLPEQKSLQWAVFMSSGKLKSSCSLSLPPSLYLSPSRTDTPPPSLPHSLSHTHTLSLLNTLSHPLSHTLSPDQKGSPWVVFMSSGKLKSSCSLSLPPSLSLSPSRTHTLSLCLSLSHTHTISLSNTHSHTLSLSPDQKGSPWVVFMSSGKLKSSCLIELQNSCSNLSSERG